eukprot:156346-Chlamydomonas_euryale.AAC.7
MHALRCASGQLAGHSGRCACVGTALHRSCFVALGTRGASPCHNRPTGAAHQPPDQPHRHATIH